MIAVLSCAEKSNKEHPSSFLCPRDFNSCIQGNNQPRCYVLRLRFLLLRIIYSDLTPLTTENMNWKIHPQAVDTAMFIAMFFFFFFCKMRPSTHVCQVFQAAFPLSAPPGSLSKAALFPSPFYFHSSQLRPHHIVGPPHLPPSGLGWVNWWNKLDGAPRPWGLFLFFLLPFSFWTE